MYLLLLRRIWVKLSTVFTLLLARSEHILASTAMAVALLALKNRENKKLSSKLPPVHTPIDRNSQTPHLGWTLINRFFLLPLRRTQLLFPMCHVSRATSLRFLSIHKRPKKKGTRLCRVPVISMIVVALQCNKGTQSGNPDRLSVSMTNFKM